MKVSNKFSPLMTRNQRQKLTSKKVVLKVSPRKKKDVEDPISPPEDVISKKKPGRPRKKKVLLEEEKKKSISVKLSPIPKKTKNKSDRGGKNGEDKPVDEEEKAITSILVKSILTNSSAKYTKDDSLIKNQGSGMKKRIKHPVENNVNAGRLQKKTKKIMKKL